MIDQLPSAMRNNLLVLQNNGRQQQDIQQRLSTGLKVNSALDGPQSFFAAKNLQGRADDLQALKDTMGQGVSTIQAADKGVSAISDLLKQARGLTSSALANLENTPAGLSMRKTLAGQFDRIRAQIDRVAQDSGYAGKNLLVGNGLKLAATSESRRLATNLTGVRHADLTNVTKEDDYRIEVVGSRQISGLDADIQNAEQLFGFRQLKVDGQQSGTQGSFDDIRFELHGLPGRDATLVVLDGEESWTVKLTADELAGMVEEQRTMSVSRTFNSGAAIDLEIDPAALQAALQPSGMVKASVQRDVDLEVKVTNNTGVSISRSGNTQDNGARLFAGENAFRFEGGTVRLDIDEKLISGASVPVAGPVAGNLSNVELVVRSNPVFDVNNKVGTNGDVDGDGFLGAGDGFEIDFRLSNNTKLTAAGVSFSNSTFVNIDSSAQASDFAFGFNNGAQFGNVLAGASIITDAGSDLDFDIPAGASDDDRFMISMDITSDGETRNVVFGPFVVGALRNGDVIAIQSTNPPVFTPSPPVPVLTARQTSDADTENDLQVQFNADNSSNLNLSSTSVRTDGQGLRLDASANEWRDRDDIEQAIADLGTAESRLQTASRQQQVNMDVISTRLEFTDTISLTLDEGAAKLTQADQNEEATRSLALDVRRQLATISLSLSSAGLQSILRLF